MTKFQKELLQKLYDAGGAIMERALSGAEVRTARHSLGGLCRRRFFAYKGHAIEITDAGLDLLRQS